MLTISIVLPAHNEEKNLSLLIPEIIKNIPKKYDYEIICVDDGSSDNTINVIKKFALKNKKVKGIFFYRNFGHQQALRVGIEKSQGDAVITMDSDFQHPPELISELISLWEKGYDLVQAQKKLDKTTSLWMNMQRKIGYFVWARITDGIILPGVSDFRLMSRSIASYIAHSYETEIFLRGLVQLAAKKPTVISYNVGKRMFGKSSYDMRKFFNMFVTGFISFSIKPLRLAWVLGLLISAGSIFYILVDSIFAIFSGRQIIEGWKTVVTLLLILNGFIIFFLGILGEYIGIIFKETKGRPKYIIDKTINFDK